LDAQRRIDPVGDFVRQSGFRSKCVAPSVFVTTSKSRMLFQNEVTNRTGVARPALRSFLIHSTPARAYPEQRFRPN